ncbi:unnamed protein product [Notodromas monacha]|uniref:Uncharacterized protein n=1 Tax=Notodromas monacha TaxID=399045 RepID=A0A7R9GFD1_9CRUS|nr:unnamed protein product [Notodromas monacha]CAG0920667.1 unnamed protein product [Notodromas monacha]
MTGPAHIPDSRVSDAPQAVTRLRPAGVPPPGPRSFLGLHLNKARLESWNASLMYNHEKEKCWVQKVGVMGGAVAKSSAPARWGSMLPVDPGSPPALSNSDRWGSLYPVEWKVFLVFQRGSSSDAILPICCWSIIESHMFSFVLVMSSGVVIKVLLLHRKRKSREEHYKHMNMADLDTVFRVTTTTIDRRKRRKGMRGLNDIFDGPETDHSCVQTDEISRVSCFRLAVSLKTTGASKVPEGVPAPVNEKLPTKKMLDGELSEFHPPGVSWRVAVNDERTNRNSGQDFEGHHAAVSEL